MTPIIVALFACAVAFLLTPLARALSLRLDVIDRPNARSSHTVPTPRSGGIAILAGVFASAFAVRGMEWFAVGMLLVAIVGFVDDLRGLRAAVRFGAQLFAGAFVVFGSSFVLQVIDLPYVRLQLVAPLAIAVTLFWIVGVTNGYNFMDGINGIAALEAIAAGATLSVLFLRIGHTSHAVLAAAFAGAALGFLPWNFPKARIFMGDVASGALGFAFAALAVMYAKYGGSFIAAGLVLAPFLFDTGITILRRITRREHLATAHRTHFYQRLTILGWSHTSVSLLWFVLAIVSGAAGVVYASADDMLRAVLLGTVLLFHVGIAVAITVAERRGV